MNSIILAYLVFLSYASGFKLGNLDHTHDHEHGHDHENDHDHNHKEGDRMEKSISFDDDLELNTIPAAGNIDFGRAVPTTLSDGSVRLCVEKEEFRTEVRY